MEVRGTTGQIQPWDCLWSVFTTTMNSLIYELFVSETYSYEF